MTKIACYKDLIVWQKSVDLVENIYQMTKGFPSTEQWGLTVQMRRAAISVSSNIAEGFGRQATGEYKHHLAIARGSVLELETQLIIAVRLGYLSEIDSNSVNGLVNEISRMLATLISKLKKPRGSRLEKGATGSLV